MSGSERCIAALAYANATDSKGPETDVSSPATRVHFE